MIQNENILNLMNSPLREIEGRVYAFESGSTSAKYTFRNTDRLKSYTIERAGDSSKFFGYGICTKSVIKVLDADRSISLDSSNRVRPFVIDKLTRESVYIYPFLDIAEITRDENTNELSITSYDALYKAKDFTVNDLNLSTYTINEFVKAIATKLGLSGVKYINVNNEAFGLLYENGANFEGTEDLRQALDTAAEATQTIYYISSNNMLTFKRLDISGEAVLTIDKEKYFTMDSKTPKKVIGVCNATELGDNVEAKLDEEGTIQYVRNNAFWELREDIAELVEKALAVVGGLTITQFNCNWRGNFLLEIGDKIDLITKDDNTIFSYVLNDSLVYDGSLSEDSCWTYEANESETASNPSTLGEVLKQTYAKVDKINQKIEIAIHTVEDNTQEIAEIQLKQGEIETSVSKIEKEVNDNFTDIDKNIDEIKTEIAAKMTSEEVTLEVNRVLSEKGTDKVETSTGFTFNEEGLKVNKSGSEMTTTITEDGMKVKQNNEDVLTANNQGVDARNLSATTYLIVGGRSRFENYDFEGKKYTACFWIGGD